MKFRLFYDNIVNNFKIMYEPLGLDHENCEPWRKKIFWASVVGYHDITTHVYVNYMNISCVTGWKNINEKLKSLFIQVE